MQDQAQGSVPAPPPPALAQLGELMKAGVLTEAEFQRQKARILNG
ncbi:MAG: SHOCT domain-containing protein [Cryobacterium sp.]|nr:SHOCT domain-containing protein [Cryobacterium sp.]